MASVEKSIIINKPADEIWAFLSDTTRWEKWFSGLGGIKVTSGDGDVGTTVEANITIANIPLPTRLEVVEARPGEYWKAEFSSPGAVGTMEWFYQAMGSRTKITFKIQADLKGAAKLAGGMITKNFEGIAGKTLENIKAQLEG